MIVTDSTYDWLTWGLMDCPKGRLSPDLLAQMEVDRQRAASLPLAAARLPIGWSYDSTLRTRSARAGVRRAWRGGCSLGFGGSSGPAVALLRDDCAVRATIPNSLSERDWEVVDLLGRMDVGAVQDFLTQLPKPRGLNSRGRRV